jgi:outer membrane protein assembly factor BamE (lipoprotein component of BamABCDE complex)
VLSRSPILVDSGALVAEISSGIDGHALGDVMRRSDIAVAMILISLVLTGCTSVGNDSIADATNETVSQHLVKGRTTQADVRKVFGDPIKTSFASNGNESWEYEFSRMQSRSPISYPM